jgi:hypothetical protein
MAAKALGVTEPTVRTSLTHLEKLRIVKEMTGRQRNRLFMYEKYLDILDEGTAPLRAFKTGARRNDIYERMRGVAAKLTDQEIDALARFYSTTTTY